MQSRCSNRTCIDGIGRSEVNREDSCRVGVAIEHVGSIDGSGRSEVNRKDS